MTATVTEQLAELEKLRATKVINDTEFSALKSKLIAEAIGTHPSRDGEPSPNEKSESKPAQIVRVFQRIETMLLIFVLLGGLGSILYPMLMEGVSGPCAAVESKYYRQFLGSDGAETAALVKSYYREMPPSFSCLLMYYGKIKVPGY